MPTPIDGAANGAIDACGRAVAAIETAMHRFDGARLAAIEEWIGPHRLSHDEAVARLAGSTADAIAALVAVRRRLLAAQADARVATFLTRGAC